LEGKSKMSLIYVPVSTDYDCLINQYHPHPLFNPIRQDINRLIETKINSLGATFCDSGGLQLVNFEKDPDKPCMVVVGVGIKKQKNLTVIDPIDVCRCYGKLRIKFGFTLDHPMSYVPGIDEYDKKLKNSYRWASFMFNVKEWLCPDTKLLIPLQFSSKAQLHEYFERMEPLQPDGYAFPGRGRWCSAKAITIACTLCYLHSKKVEKVHLLGSSRREIIIIAAAAIGLRMYKQLSFDSRTWNTINFNKKLIVINPGTLSQRKINSARFEDLYLIEPSLRDRLFDLEEDNKRLLMLHNAYAISQYANGLANIANEIADLKSYLPLLMIRGKGMKRVLTAIGILERYLDNDYGFIEKWLSGIWA
jgi:queuine/archaeosine tRNA-ribosyltransferase